MDEVRSASDEVPMGKKKKNKGGGGGAGAAAAGQGSTAAEAAAAEIITAGATIKAESSGFR